MLLLTNALEEELLDEDGRLEDELEELEEEELEDDEEELLLDDELEDGWLEEIDWRELEEYPLPVDELKDPMELDPLE